MFADLSVGCMKGEDVLNGRGQASASSLHVLDVVVEVVDVELKLH